VSDLNSIIWQWKSFDDLAANELYRLLKLRQDVFILEQQCLYPDLDDLDPACLHLLGIIRGDLQAYLRFIPAEHHNSGNIALGRILTHQTLRGKGIATGMMRETMSFLEHSYPGELVQLSAQQHLCNFYQRFGFEPISDPYDEDGIMHVDMLFKPENGYNN
jgi:ElaA protein